MGLICEYTGISRCLYTCSSKPTPIPHGQTKYLRNSPGLAYSHGRVFGSLYFTSQNMIASNIYFGYQRLKDFLEFGKTIAKSISRGVVSWYLSRIQVGPTKIIGC